MSIKQNFPTIRPTLNLDFANSRAVDSRIQFTRASAATVTDALGIQQTVRDNKPRIDFDPSTGECKGLLIEEQRTNITDIGNTALPYYDYGGYLIPRATIAPDGTMSGYLLKSDGSSNSSRIVVSIASAGTYTFSIYAKQGTSSEFGFWIYASGWINTGSFVWTNGVLTTSGDASRSVQSVGNGWYRAIITATVPSGGSVVIGPAAYSNATISSSTYFWGYQQEVGTFATSYIPTTTTFTSRASSATYYDSTGVLRTAPANGARYGYGYDSATQKWVSQGLILEAAVTNLIPTSSLVTFNTGQNMDTISTSVTAIDGTIGNVYKLTPTTTSSGTHSIYKNISSSTPSTRCVSVYLKAAGYNYVRIYCDGNTPTVGGVVYDLSTGTASIDSFYAGANRVAYGMENVGNGWYRCWVSGTATNADWYYHIDVADTAAFTSFAGDGSSGVYAWGSQMEIGSVPTSYIATYGSTATRAADVSTSAATTRAADTAVIKPAEFTKLNSPLAGTLYGEASIISGTAASDGVPALVALSNSVDRDTYRFILRRTTMNSDVDYAGFNYRLATVINGNSYSIDYSAAEGVQPEWEDSAVHKTIFGIDATSQQAYGDGVSAGITSIAIPNFDKFDQVEIGYAGSSSYWNGHIRKITYYNKRLSNTQLQALTV